jgi:Haem-binding domain
MVLKKILILSGIAMAAAGGGSLLHPFRSPAIPGTQHTILRGARIDPETLALFRRGCQNCHSQQTEWPWYSHVAPVSWLLARDVQQARLHLDLSQWQEYTPDERLRLLSEIGSAVRNRAMPIQRYLLLHPEARLSAAERQTVYRWTRTERSRVSLPQTASSVSSDSTRTRSSAP